ncbi:MAG: alpha/beta hydrolase-fold protein [Myxococcota bacterium]|nr:alpha/beta hydrolase-fold protein [Myxococcota bacterium]
MWSYGHWGTPVIAFPTAAGMAHEWAAAGAVDALRPLLQNGWLKLYCPESEACRSWTATDRPAQERLAHHAAYERFVVTELVPWIYADCRTPRLPIGLVGASLGATYAALFALKHPRHFPWAIGLSGRYHTTPMLNGQGGADAYFNDPLAFVPNLHGEALARVRDQTHLTLVVGQGPHENRCIGETVALSRALKARRIAHTLDVWGRDVSHEWTWWRRQLRHHVGAAIRQRRAGGSPGGPVSGR